MVELLTGLVLAETSKYLLDNALVIIVITLALTVSKSRMIPLYLLIYVCFMTIMMGTTQEHLNWLFDNRMYDLYNFASVRAYLFEGVVMMAFGAISFVNVTRMAMITSVTILSQGFMSFITGAIMGISVEMNHDLSLWFDVHYSIQSLYVVLYCLIAWMCVYYSRIKPI